MGKSRVTDDGYSREESCIGSALCHRDTGAHIYTGRKTLERRQRTKRIATDVAKDAMLGIVGQHLIQRGIDIPMATALTELRGTCRHVLGRSKDCTCCLSECLCHIVGIEFASTRQVTSQASLYGIARTKQALHQFLYDRLSVFNDEQVITICSQCLYLLFGQGILRNLHKIGIVTKSFLHIVVGNAASQNARLGVRSLNLIIRTLCRCLLHRILLFQKSHILLPCDARQENPLVGGWREEFLCLWFGNFDSGTRMSQSGHNTKYDGFAQLLRQVETVCHHVVGLLLVRGFEARNECELGIEARVLFVLRGMHRGVVGS